MVGIFLRFSVRRGGHRRTQCALDEREVLPPNADVTGTAAGTAAAPHGIEVTVQFKPVEHPIEPLKFSTMTNQFSARFLNLEFLILWKERVSATVHRGGDLPVMKEGGALESESVESRPWPNQSNPLILPSIGALEHNLLKLLEECNASGT